MTTDDEVFGADIGFGPSDECRQANGVARSVVGAIAIGIGLRLRCISPAQCALTQFDNCANTIVPDGIVCVVRDNILSCIILITACRQNDDQQCKDGFLNSNQSGR